jgi:hypothetical protein
MSVLKGSYHKIGWYAGVLVTSLTIGAVLGLILFLIFSLVLWLSGIVINLFTAGTYTVFQVFSSVTFLLILMWLVAGLALAAVLVLLLPLLAFLDCLLNLIINLFSAAPAPWATFTKELAGNFYDSLSGLIDGASDAAEWVKDKAKKAVNWIKSWF